MKHLFFLIALVASLSLNAQITKNNWLVGGSAAFSYVKQKSGSESEQFNFDLSPNFGYFFWDRIAVGSKGEYIRNSNLNTSGSSEILFLSPFARYYISAVESISNFFVEASYGYNLISNNNSEQYSIKGGLALFLNSSVAFEIAVSYVDRNSKSQFVGSRRILLGFGLQIHLEKL
ncbi:hypothetical protein [Psychroflexus montanilacus]|uniref:hypothetical protein n=1 Tax=Psychroflexus montanilacus TaxID=2873598 RepID=UPI001CCA890C|nr:hypothetical protein [Psychroflexus montanilacus]MBZ9651546.1 hypothetical protein [Psychroflexus montanilacus]